MRKIVSSLILGLVAVMCIAGCGGEDQLRGEGASKSDRPRLR